jgi:hypothetical protein
MKPSIAGRENEFSRANWTQMTSELGVGCSQMKSDSSVAVPGCFIPDPDIFSFRIPDPDSNIFIPDPI